MPQRPTDRTNQEISPARQSRRAQTIAEDTLWQALRTGGFGVRFKRRVPIGAFIADFACLERKLVVEVAGPAEGAAEADNWRHRCFRENGWHVVRVSSAGVTTPGAASLDPIRAALAGLPGAAPD
jgi:very-short-patch-repair endonuclease